MARRLALLALAAVIGFLLSAIQVLPSSEAARLSDRAAYDRPRNVYEAAATLVRPSAQDKSPEEPAGKAIVHGLLGTPAPGSHHESAFDFSIGPWRLAEYVWPNVGGRMYPTHRRWFSLIPAEGRIWTPSLYLGLLPLALGLSALGLRHSQDVRQTWLSWLVVLFTLGSFGFYGLGWIVREVAGSVLRQDTSQITLGPAVGGVYWLFTVFLPGYVYFRYPAKLLPVVALGLSQLAALGLDRALAQPRPGLRRWLMILGIASAVAALPAWLLATWWLPTHGVSDATFGPFDVRGAGLDVLAALVQTASVALAGWWLLTPQRVATQRDTTQLAIVLLTAAELTAANAWLIGTAPAQEWEQESAIARQIHLPDRESATASPPPRVYRGGLTSWRPPQFRHTMSANRLGELVAFERDTLFPKHHLQSNVALVESYGSLNLYDYQVLLEVARQHGPRAEGKLLPQATALRLLGAEFLMLQSGQQPEFAERVERAADSLDSVDTLNADVWKMHWTLPRAWIVHEVEMLPPLPDHAIPAEIEERTRQVLFPGGRARDFLRLAVVETERSLRAETNDSAPDRGASGARNGGELMDEHCRIIRYEPQQVVVEATLAAPGLVVLSDLWFPGWEARVTSNDNLSRREATIVRTNRVLRGVWLPAGEHTIEFRYRPLSFFIGAGLSLAAWCVLAVYFRVHTDNCVYAAVASWAFLAVEGRWK